MCVKLKRKPQGIRSLTPGFAQLSVCCILKANWLFINQNLKLDVYQLFRRTLAMISVVRL